MHRTRPAAMRESSFQSNKYVLRYADCDTRRMQIKTLWLGKHAKNCRDALSCGDLVSVIFGTVRDTVAELNSMDLDGFSLPRKHSTAIADDIVSGFADELRFLLVSLGALWLFCSCLTDVSIHAQSTYECTRGVDAVGNFSSSKSKHHI